MVKPSCIFIAISKYYMKIYELKFTSGISEADLMVQYTPNLKLLSVRKIMANLNLRGLCNILNSFEKLEVLMFCNRRRCLRCRNGNAPVRGPFGVFEDIWREDEIRPLAH
ncbi:hypothetical protein MTR_1g041650 [Medicago truncatula]|uniref:Uncharacterized protein n=1 Tax=Medicago truncatula TaxID=3880 RepID=G7I2J8_MEDTR|nr:hypothetical protein MTR_1g041650 [Medicago truncatula]